MRYFVGVFFKPSVYFILTASQLGPATFQVLNSHMWLVATVLISIALGCRVHENNTPRLFHSSTVSQCFTQSVSDAQQVLNKCFLS